MQGSDEVTEPGGPTLLDGSEEVRALANLAVMLKFYTAQVEQMMGEARRAPLEADQRAALWHRLRGLANDFAQTANAMAPWNAPRAGPAKP